MKKRISALVLSSCLLAGCAGQGAAATGETAAPSQAVPTAAPQNLTVNGLLDTSAAVSALELYAYKACVDSAIFHDVISSAVVRWDEVRGHGSVSNEIDVMAARGVIPLFLSCKACDIKTEALNELAILRDRFGGKGAKAAIVTTEVCNAAARHRAAQLGIAVIDLEELKTGQLVHRLKVIMKAE